LPNSPKILTTIPNALLANNNVAVELHRDIVGSQAL
jgi:hypothetical protein